MSKYKLSKNILEKYHFIQIKSTHRIWKWLRLAFNGQSEYLLFLHENSLQVRYIRKERKSEGIIADLIISTDEELEFVLSRINFHPL